jgi:hypothetical protein
VRVWGLTMKARTLGRLSAPAVIAAFALISLSLAGCGQRPRVDVSATIEDGRVVFDVPHSGMNEIMSIRVKEQNGELIWHLSLGSQNWHKEALKVTYGVVPPRETDLEIPPSQIFPSDNTPPRNIRGETLNVLIEYQYDSGLAACAGSFSKTLKVP